MIDIDNWVPRCDRFACAPVSFAEFGYTVSNPWPADRYDQEDRVFFVARDASRDFATIDYNWDFSTHNPTPETR